MLYEERQALYEERRSRDTGDQRPQNAGALQTSRTEPRRTGPLNSPYSSKQEPRVNAVRISQTSEPTSSFESLRGAQPERHDRPRKRQIVDFEGRPIEDYDGQRSLRSGQSSHALLPANLRKGENLDSHYGSSTRNGLTPGAGGSPIQAFFSSVPSLDDSIPGSPNLHRVPNGRGVNHMYDGNEHYRPDLITDDVSWGDWDELRQFTPTSNAKQRMVANNNNVDAQHDDTDAANALFMFARGAKSSNQSSFLPPRTPSSSARLPPPGSHASVVLSSNSTAPIPFPFSPAAYDEQAPLSFAHESGVDPKDNPFARMYGSADGKADMFITYTISEDLTGNQDSVMNARLAGLAARCGRSSFSQMPDQETVGVHADRHRKLDDIPGVSRGNGSRASGDVADSGVLPPGTVSASLTEEDDEAVQRLFRLSFDRQAVIDAYFACDKNEELAANFLFDQSEDDEEEEGAGPPRIAIPTLPTAPSAIRTPPWSPSTLIPKDPPVNPADQNPPCNTLYVGNLPVDTSEEELKALFSSQPGYKRLAFRTKQNGPMAFVEFEGVSSATKAMQELYGVLLSNSVKGSIRLSFSKNSLGVRDTQLDRRYPDDLFAIPAFPRLTPPLVQQRDSDGSDTGNTEFPYGVDPSTDTELALALHMSIEEGQARINREKLQTTDPKNALEPILNEVQSSLRSPGMQIATGQEQRAGAGRGNEDEIQSFIQRRLAHHQGTQLLQVAQNSGGQPNKISQQRRQRIKSISRQQRQPINHIPQTHRKLMNNISRAPMQAQRNVLARAMLRRERLLALQDRLAVSEIDYQGNDP